MTAWPPLALADWRDTCDTLHMYAQIVGKIKLALAPPEPEWAHVGLAVTARGLSTGPLRGGERTFQIDFNLIDHVLAIPTSGGPVGRLALRPRSVADFYVELFELLRELEIAVHIWTMPVEVAAPIRFTEDRLHAAYDREAVGRFFTALALAHEALSAHRAPFRGRHTPVQFFWGTFDLAYTRYSGRPATPPPGADRILRVSMDAEDVSAGFWPGDERFPEPAFFAYAYPKPEGYERAAIAPPRAFWNESTGLYLLRYDDVRAAGDPRAALADFFTSTFRSAAELAHWEGAP